tara:strand:+ start:15618 stop:16484 length:867 start_codon:yes stop_codon:yes gene_type:complete
MNVLRPIQKEFYGDDVRWFLGYVINSVAPAGLEGRVKVRIIGVHNPDVGEIPERDLPWAQVIVPTTEGGSSGIGRIPQLTKGAFVFGVFLDGMTSQLPLVLGTLPRIELPSSSQTGRGSLFADDTFQYTQNKIQNVVIEPLYDDTLIVGDTGTRRLQSMKFFIDNGYTVMHAAVITAGLENASRFVLYSTESSTGIGNWNVDKSSGCRFTNLQSFAYQFRPASNWKALSVQLQFVLFELRTRFNLANSKLIATETIKEASEVFRIYYLENDNGSFDQIAQRAYDEVFV